MAQNNIINVGLAGSNGTGNFVGATSPSLTTPNIGVATATSIVFSPTTSGIIGTTTNDSAAAGKVGEVITANVTYPGNSLSANTATNVTSISLTAGDWDVWGNVLVTGASGTSVTEVIGWISTVSATLPNQYQVAHLFYGSANILGGASLGIVCPYQRVSLSGTTTVYLSVQAAFTVSTMTMAGQITGRRAR